MLKIVVQWKICLKLTALQFCITKFKNHNDSLDSTTVTWNIWSSFCISTQKHSHWEGPRVRHNKRRWVAVGYLASNFPPQVQTWVFRSGGLGGSIAASSCNSTQHPVKTTCFLSFFPDTYLSAMSGQLTPWNSTWWLLNYINWGSTDGWCILLDRTVSDETADVVDVVCVNM